MVGTLVGGMAVSAGTQVAGQLQGQATNMLSSVTGNITGGVTNFISNLVGGILSGPTGASAVDMENERKSGNAFFHGAKVKGKWNDFDYVLKTMNKGGLQSFGWGFGKTPSSASGNFKKAENAFFEVLAPFLDKVIAGTAQFPKNFDNDPIVISYLEKNMKSTAKPPVKTSLTTFDNLATATNLSKSTQTQTKSQSEKKGGSFPWWIAIPFLI